MEHWFTPAALDTEPFEVVSRETGRVICEALTESPDLDALRGRVDALCASRPLYPGFRGYTTYVSS